jgi:hypothetical protein
MRRLPSNIHVFVALLLPLFSANPLRSMTASDPRLLSLVPPDARIVAGMDAPPPKGTSGSFVLMTRNTRIDLADVLALTGADSSRTIRHAVFIARGDDSGELSEHSLILSGHFDQTHIYKSVKDGGDVATNYRGIPVLEIQPLARERAEFNEPRWLAIPDPGLLLFGSITSVQEELDRYLAGSSADPLLIRKLDRLGHDHETWCMLTATGRNTEVRAALASLDAKLADLAGNAEAFDFGIRYRKQVELEYEVTTASTGATWPIPGSVKHALVGPGKESSLLNSWGTTGRVNIVHGTIKIPLERFTAWLQNVTAQQLADSAVPQ